MFKNKKIYKIFIMSIFALILLFAAGCSNAAKEQTTETGSKFLMDTLVQMKVTGKNAEKVLNLSFDRIEELENLMSKTLKKSEIYKINHSSEPVEISDDTIKVLNKSIHYAELTSGRFDPSIGPLVELWGIGTEDARVPTEEEIAEAKKLVNYKNIEIDNNKVFLKQKDMQLDLGAIAKGYAADEVKRIAEENNIKSAFVNLGGNVLVIGHKADGSKWRIGIQDPRKNRGNIMAVIKAVDKTIVTSGNYERYFEKNGNIYHHIIDPATGYPADSGLLSVSIISESSFDADALSTSVFILGLEKGMEFIKDQKNVEVLFITEDLKVYLSPGLKGKVEITGEEFELIEGELSGN
ncbi:MULTISPECIES: FAD:protein FMN transferase [unclassified Halanaerobium]|uniref:FAD:protein FMN transferase n=1 Tax=unclassified Halanaerobium TaxID=2641197 RepID=UPI000E1529B4|nr:MULTISPECIES: FAD:protein FMN transferase [unclassified Halanaerobium]RCW40337.1 thiamine biosynthesis lipoprotein [Halanaerobium sp. MA284_MarDTE_T2]RCW87997.1 thiamine biosynthesis lipoprotein [Halanaerobium sp. DL-01]